MPSDEQRQQPLPGLFEPLQENVPKMIEAQTKYTPRCATVSLQRNRLLPGQIAPCGMGKTIGNRQHSHQRRDSCLYVCLYVQVRRLEVEAPRLQPGEEHLNAPPQAVEAQQPAQQPAHRAGDDEQALLAAFIVRQAQGVKPDLLAVDRAPHAQTTLLSYREITEKDLGALVLSAKAHASIFAKRRP